MPPQSKISQLPEDLRLWLEDELAASGCTNYGSITTALNRKLMELGNGGEISREAVRRFGVKLSAKLDVRDRLFEHIRDELDPERTLPPADWNRAVISAIGFLNYRTLTDLQCQETVTVKEHGAFVRGLLQTHKYEKLLCVEPLRYEEVGAIGRPESIRASVLSTPPSDSSAATLSFRPEPDGRSGGISCQPEGETPPLRAAPSGRGDTGENMPEHAPVSVLPQENTEKHGTTHYVSPQSGQLTRQQRRRLERLAAREAEKVARKGTATGVHHVAA